MQQLLERGALNSLPTDMQWNVRMLLPRRAQAFPPPPSSAPGSGAVPLQGTPPVSGSLALPQIGLSVPGMLDPSQVANLGLASTAPLAFLGGATLLPLLQPAVQVRYTCSCMVHVL